MPMVFVSILKQIQGHSMCQSQECEWLLTALGYLVFNLRSVPIHYDSHCLPLSLLSKQVKTLESILSLGFIFLMSGDNEALHIQSLSKDTLQERTFMCNMWQVLKSHGLPLLSICGIQCRYHNSSRLAVGWFKRVSLRWYSPHEEATWWSKLCWMLGCYNYSSPASSCFDKEILEVNYNSAMSMTCISPVTLHNVHVGSC